VGSRGAANPIAPLSARRLGNLKLTDQEEDAVVAFLKTLADGYKLPNQQAAK